MMRVCLCGAPKAVHSDNGGCTWCSCDKYEEDVRSTVPDDKWMSIIPERGYFR